MKRHAFYLLLVIVSVSMRAMECKEINVFGKRYVMVDTQALTLYFNRQGGRLDRIFYKKPKQEFTTLGYRGVFTENEWNKEALSRDFLYKRLFSLTHEKQGDSIILTFKGHHTGGGIDFLEVTKRYTIHENSPRIKLDYTFHNQREAMSPILYAIHIHSGLTLVGEPKPAYYIPSVQGITQSGGEHWEHSPARGWIGATNQKGVGLATTMSFHELHNMLIWNVKTIEWRYVPQYINAGESWKTSVEIIPFTQLPRVSGAGNGVVGAFLHEEHATPGDRVPVTVRINNDRAPEVLEVQVRARETNRAPWNILKTETLTFDKMDQMKSFSVKVQRSSAGRTELEAIVKAEGKELTRLNSSICYGKTDAPWKIDLLQPRKKGILKGTDLTGFTHVQPDPKAIKWATPLPKGPIKVLALAPYIYQIGDLSHRLDMTYAMSWIYQNCWQLSGGSCLLCEGNCNLKTVFQNIRKVLKKTYDVILIGGISWANFPTDIQNMILDHVKAGTGLVYTGLDEGNPAMQLTGRRRDITQETPQAVQNCFLTAGVPFDIFPKANVFCLKGGQRILAKAGPYSYLSTASFGKGEIISYAYAPNLYHTGIIPHDPADPYYVYENPTPFELYFAMLAKGIHQAAGRKPGFTFENFRYKDKRLCWQIKTQTSQQTTWEYTVTDRNNKQHMKGTRKVKLTAGDSTVTFSLPLPCYAGKQLFSVIVRNEKGQVLNWGSWSFQNQPNATITSISTTKKNYVDGDTIAFEAKLSGTLAGMKLNMELVDSYGRRLQKQCFTPKQVVKGTFKLTNNLPARFARIRGYLMDNGIEVDTNGCWFYTRPSEKLMKWDDFYINSIIYWSGQTSFYRMRKNMDAYRKLGLDMLMNCWGLDYVLLNNLMPQTGVGCRIGSQNYPSQAYLETGDKRLLKRKNCLSDAQKSQDFYQKVEKKVQQGYKYGAMFYDVGDEIALSRCGSPVDFCFSDDCLNNFRRFLQQRYGSLAHLNKAWETSFTQWNQVMPFTKEEVWKGKEKHVAGWADHREFMDELCYQHLKEIKRRIHKHDPHGMLSVSGTMVPNAYGGLDWWKLMKVYDSMQNYSERMHNEIQRSFARPGYTSFPWNIGYGKTGQVQVYWTWYSPFMGCKGISLWCLHSGILFPDLLPQRGIRDALPGLTRLHDGVGKLLMDVYLPSTPKVAILYSQPSLRAAFIEKRMDEHISLWEKYILLCRNLGADFNFVSYEQLAHGHLDNSPYKMLILTDAAAMTDREIDSIKRFFNRGGVILAEGIPARRQANCVKRTTLPLMPLFLQGKGRATLLEEPDTDYVTLISAPDSKLNRAQIIFEQERFAAHLKKADIPYQTFKFMNEDGTPLLETMQYLKQGNGSWLAGVMTNNQKLKKITIELPREGHVYDVVSGAYLGTGKTCKANFQQGRPLGLALLPAPINWQAVTANGHEVIMRLNQPIESIAHVTVTAPDGIPVREYGKNVRLNQGKATYGIPFALSDAKGAWKVKVTEVISGKSMEISMRP